MADLSEIDKKTLLGENYRVEELRWQRESGTTDAMVAHQERVARLNAVIGAALYFGLVGALILLSQYYGSQSHQPALITMAGGALVLSLIAGIWAASQRRPKRARARR